MNKNLCRSVSSTLWLSIYVLGCFSLYAAETDIDPSDFGSESVGPTPQTPFSVNVSLDYISPAKVKKGFFKDDEITFTEGTADASMVFYYEPACSEAANVGLGYTTSWIHWEQNPWFSQEYFHTVSLALGGFSGRLEDWVWRGQLQINYDTGSHFSAEYFNYDFLLWGRYSVKENMGLHIGIFAETGMRTDRILPVLGIDWRMNPKWSINLVFPLNVSIKYLITPRWSLSLAGRVFDSRHRVRDDQSFPKAVIRYTNTGGEMMLKYEIGTFVFNVHGGSTFGGQYRIASPHNHQPHHYKIKPSLYGGVEADLKF